MSYCYMPYALCLTLLFMPYAYLVFVLVALGLMPYATAYALCLMPYAYLVFVIVALKIHELDGAFSRGPCTHI